MNVEGHCYHMNEMFLDKICNLIGWRGARTAEEPGTDPELVTSLLVYIARTQPEVRGVINEILIYTSIDLYKS